MNNISEFSNMTEEVVMRELLRLPSTHYIFKDVCLSLYRPAKYKNTQEDVRFCQIDFVVIGLRLMLYLVTLIE